MANPLSPRLRNVGRRKMTGNNDTAKDFLRGHPAGFCLPERERPLALALGSYDIPEAIDNRAYCTPVEDQGSKPWCAAYTAAAFAENVVWRREGVIRQVEEADIYAWAKAHDGIEGDGTTLSAALGGLLRCSPSFDIDICRVRGVYGEEAARIAIHRFGCFLAGFDITKEWYDPKKAGLCGAKCVIASPVSSRNPKIGGHAVLVVAYDGRGVWVENSWGDGWGKGGFGFVSWAAFNSQFMGGAVLTHALDGFK